MPPIEPHPEPRPNPPIRQSQRTPKPSARKRANSESISQPLPSPQRVKKARRATLLPACPPQQQIATDDEAEASEDEDIASSIMDNDSLEALGSREQVEDVDEEEEEGVVKYRSVWKALVNEKEIIYAGSQFFTEDLTIRSIQRWQKKVLEDAAPRQLEVVKLEAIASHGRRRTLDEWIFELRSQRDIYNALKILEIWHDQRKRAIFRITLHLREAVTEPQSQPDSSIRIAGRRAATQRQLAELPDILHGDAAAGNSMPQVADYWTCVNSRCRNKGKTCWVNKPRPDVRDNAAEHYPVPRAIFRRWSHEIADNLSTVEEPSQQIILLLSRWREKEREKDQHIPRPVEDTATSQLLRTVIATQAQQTLIVAQILQIIQSLSDRLNSQTHPPPYAPPEPSSPVHSNSDPDKVLTQFFDWFLTNSRGQQPEVLEDIKNKLLSEDWTLDNLRDERRGGQMTFEIWQSYGFTLGMLANIQDRISDFKKQRRPLGRGSVGSS